LSASALDHTEETIPSGNRFRLEPVAMMACSKSIPLTSPPSMVRLVAESKRA
jgi:hypothetical protein